MARAESAGAGVDSIPNFRDVGGHRTRGGGVVRRGLLYRSTALHRASPGAVEALEALGIRTVFDLRTAGERDVWPEADRLPAGATYVVADVLRDADTPEARPAEMRALLADPERVQAMLGSGRGERMFLARYREFVNLTSGRQAYHRVLADLATPGTTPAIVHCMTGKDRAGWSVAVLLLLLGVPEEAVVEDYLASNAALTGLHAEMTDEWVADGRDPALLEPMLGVRVEYLEAALDEVRRGFGSIDGYVESGLAIGPMTRRRLVATFVERA